jgi:heptosyltransferase I
VVSPDTGPLHAAVAMNVPTIGLYGYTDPRRTGPYRYRDLLVDRYHEPDGERGPVRRTTRAGRVALITPDEVIAKVELALARYRPGLASGSGQ